MRTILMLGAVLGLLTWGPAATAAPVDVTLFSDANGEVASISVFGKANCASGDSLNDPCLAASAANDASACQYGVTSGCGTAVSGTGNSDGYVSIAGTGTATGWVPLSGSNQCRTIFSSAWSQCFVVATSGDAAGYWLSVTPDGSADSFGIAVSGTGSSNAGLVALSGTGPSGGWLSVSGTGPSNGSMVAVSGTGGSSCRFSSCVTVSLAGAANGAIPLGLGTCNARQCFAIVPVGDAEGYWLAVAGTGSATAEWIAVSVFGDAYAPVAASLKDVLCNPDAICIRP